MLEGEYVTTDDLPGYIREDIASMETGRDKLFSGSSDIILPWEDYEKVIIKAALEKYGSYNAAGKALGLTHKTVAAKAQKYGIEKIIAWEKISKGEKSISKKQEA